MKEEITYQSKKDKGVDTIGLWIFRICIVMMLLSWLVAYWPPYEKIWYNKTKPITLEEVEAEKAERRKQFGEHTTYSFTGYPIVDKTELPADYEEFYERRDEPFCLEIDAERLQPTGVYAKVYDFSNMYNANGGSYSKYRMVRSGTVTSSYNTPPDVVTKAGAILNRYRAIYAQYYVLSLKDRDRILVLINDTVVDIPQKGKIKLPFATCSIMDVTREAPQLERVIVKHNINYKDRHTYYLDAAESWFRIGINENEFDDFRLGIAMIMLIGGAIGIFLLIVYVLIASAKQDIKK